ncbi:Leucine rich repeat containing protein BspA family protein [Entamoeba marina]
MQYISSNTNNIKLDSYSILICSKYFKTEEDFFNLICVNSKFKETTEKLRFNPIPIISLKLFPKIQTQYLYTENDNQIELIDKYEIWYKVTYDQYLIFNKNNIKFHNIVYTHENRLKYGEKIIKEVNILDDNCFGNKNWNGSSNIKEITIPYTIKSIGDGCFCFCNSLTTINLLTNLTSLGDCCFYYCSQLRSITIPSTLTSLGNYCFSECSSITSINLSSTLKLLGDSCFSFCESLESIILPSSLTSIGEGCFSYCLSLTSINLPSKLTSLKDNCFRYCASLKSINLPSTIESFGKSCLYRCHQLKGTLNAPDECFFNYFS